MGAVAVLEEAGASLRRWAKRTRKRRHKEQQQRQCEGDLTSLFVQMLQGLNMQDLRLLYSLDELSCGQRGYNAEDGSLCEISEYLPWPVRWLLCRFNRKHNHVGSCLPKLDAMHASIAQFENKMMWRWWHENQKERLDTDDGILKDLRLKDVSTPRCVKLVPPEVKATLHQIREAVLRACKTSRSQARGRRWSNISPLTKWALQLMRKHGWRALPLDKEPGMCLIRRDLVAGAHETILRGPACEEVCEDLELLERRVKASYYNLTQKVGNLEEHPAVTWHLGRTMEEKSFWLVSRLMLTVKSHKSPVSFRNVHNSCAAMGGLSVWLMKQLQPVLDKMEHIVKDSFELVRRIKDYGEVTSETTLIRVDVKEFYMSGNAETLSQEASKLVPPGPRRELIREVAEWLLMNQYIVSREITDRTWRVQLGSGMGQQHSGALADACFWSLVDTWILSRNVCKAFNIGLYLRFKDDLLFVTRQKQKWRDMFNIMKYRCRGTYRLWCEGVSQKAVDMLAVTVAIVGKRLHTWPKERLQSIPLSTDSAHPKSIHSMWPQSRLRGIEQLCTRSSDARVHKHNLIAICSRFGSPRWLIDVLEGRLNQCLYRASDLEREPKTWMVLPFHPVWRSEIFRKELRDVMNDPILNEFFKTLWKMAPEICISWKMPKRRFGSTLQSLGGW